MDRSPGALSPGVLSEGPYTICIPSFLATFLRLVGSVVSPREAQAFLKDAGKHVEIFLPFYRWFDDEGNVRAFALQEFQLVRRLYGMRDLRVTHAGYAGQGFLLARFFMNPADPQTQRETVARIRRELRLLRLLREDLEIAHPLLYVLHCGRREKGRGWRESFQSSVATVRAVMEEALAAGVCVSVENNFSHAGEEAIGTTLADIGELFAQVGHEWVERGVLGWTFDPSHALIAYSGNYDAIERDIRPLLPLCVHIHVNHPWTRQGTPGEILSEWGRGDDYHAAPARTPQRARFWSLVRTVVQQSRIPDWRTLTYEVNWGVPGVRWIFGGSALGEVRVGFEALERFCNHPSEQFDVAAIERYIDARLAGVRREGSP